jgi:hypothetical protein
MLMNCPSTAPQRSNANTIWVPLNLRSCQFCNTNLLALQLLLQIHTLHVFTHHDRHLGVLCCIEKFK